MCSVFDKLYRRPSLIKSSVDIRSSVQNLAGNDENGGRAQVGAAEEGDGQNTERDRRGHGEGARATKRG